MNEQELTAEETRLSELLRAHPAVAEQLTAVRAGVRLVEPRLERAGRKGASGRTRRRRTRACARGEKNAAWPCGYGTVAVSERVWRNAADEWQRPFAAAAGLTARGCSRRLQRLACDFALETPFGRATDRLLEHHGVTLAPSTLRRLTLRHAGALRDAQPARPCARCRRTRRQDYLSNQRDQLDYPAALSRHLPVGSGLIESGHRHVPHHLLKLPGVAWLRPNFEAIAHARVVRANGAWPAYWDSLALAQI